MTTTLGARLYIGAVIAAGCGLLVYFAPLEVQNPVLAAALLAATVCLSVWKLRLPLGYGVSTMSMAHVVDFVALFMEGANLAMLLGAIGVIIQCTVRVRRKQPVHRAAFSAAAVIIAVQVTGMSWHALGGSLTNLTLTSTLLPLVVCAIAYFIVNTALVVGAIAVTPSASPLRAWNPEFLRAAPAYLLAAVIAGLMALAIMHGFVLALPIVAAPLLVAYRVYDRLWRTMSTALLERTMHAGTPVAA